MTTAAATKQTAAKRTPTIQLGIAEYYIAQSQDGLTRVESGAILELLHAHVARIAEMHKALCMAEHTLSALAGVGVPETLEIVRAAIKGAA